MTVLIAALFILVVVLATAAWVSRRPNRAGTDVDRFNTARAMTTGWAQDRTSAPATPAGEEQ